MTNMQITITADDDAGAMDVLGALRDLLESSGVANCAINRRVVVDIETDAATPDANRRNSGAVEIV